MFEESHLAAGEDSITVEHRRLHAESESKGRGKFLCYHSI